MDVHHFSLKQSFKLFSFLLYFNLITLLLIVIYFNSWIQWGLISLVLLQLYSDFGRYKLVTQMALVLNLKTNEIQIEKGVNSQFFDYFRLYSNRWFLILQLRQNNRSENLMLLSDRFNSMSEYLLFRHQIKKMNRNLNVD
jgi:hypothetical protein|tara:strand:- start:464 stop:883 length:420 start_codon:yes stop_codon:yes gene_type:complete